MRLAFLCDLHVATVVAPFQQRVLDWCRDQIRAWGVEHLVFGGDLTHHASAAEVDLVLDALACDLPADYLPGNNEGRGLRLDPRHRHVNLVDAPQERGGLVLLPTTCVADAREALAWLRERRADGAPRLVLSHLAPDVFVETMPPDLGHGPTWWVAGHRHQVEGHRLGALEVHVGAGLDAVKARGRRPELLILDWSGHDAAIHRIEAPLEVLRPTPWRNPVGLACRLEAAEFLDRAVAAGVDVLQFHHLDCRDAPTTDALRARDRFREVTGGGFLSLHLPSLPPDNPDPARLAPWLTFAAGLGLDDLTFHVPKLLVGAAFDEAGGLRDTPEVAAVLAALRHLAAWAIDHGMQLNLENQHNTAGQHQPGPGELITARPGHLQALIPRLRGDLVAAGYTSAQATEGLGILFDVGHAFCDPIAAKQHGLVDWLHHLGGEVRAAHIHQVNPTPQQRGNHHPLTNRRGPMINHEGVLAAFADLVPRPVPLLIEVRDFDQALASREVLLGDGR